MHAELFQDFQHADFRRLDPHCPYTKPIKSNDVYIVITSFMDKAPGEDGIVKEHLLYLPKKCLSI